MHFLLEVKTFAELIEILVSLDQHRIKDQRIHAHVIFYEMRGTISASFLSVAREIIVIIVPLGLYGLLVIWNHFRVV